MKVALCCIVKNENDYLNEYVNYYHDLGFDKIFIYDNNDINGENPNDIIGKYNFVEIINYRGQSVVQNKAYMECAKTHKDEFQWMAFFDADELLELFKYKNIKEYLMDPIFSNFDTILINWCNFNDNDLLGNENNYDRNLFNRFKQCSTELTYQYGMVKSIINLNKIIPIFNTPHLPANCINCCNANGEKCDKSAKIKTTYKQARLNHYRKTIIEFCEHKLFRGWADGNPYKLSYKWFTDYSKDTPEKRKIYENYINKK